MFGSDLFFWLEARIMISGRVLLLLLLASAVIVGGCSPPTAPLYRDYVRPTVSEASDLRDRLEAALEQAGWTIAESIHTGVVATEERIVQNWGIYRVAVSLEAVPVGDRHVRVFVHPFRRFVTGGQSKLFALGAGLRRSLYPPLDVALTAHGFTIVDESP
jgi:hypothetical protein